MTAPSRYQPDPQSVAGRIVAYLKGFPEGTEVPGPVLAEALGVEDNILGGCTSTPIRHGVLVARKRLPDSGGARALNHYSLGIGIPIEPVDEDEDSSTASVGHAFPALPVPAASAADPVPPTPAPKPRQVRRKAKDAAPAVSDQSKATAAPMADGLWIGMSGADQVRVAKGGQLIELTRPEVEQLAVWLGTVRGATA